MRNVVTLSNIPQELHEWLKKEAARQSKATGSRIGIYSLATRAIKEYKARMEKPFIDLSKPTPAKELFRKKIQPSELARKCICIPREQQSNFGRVGNIITLWDAVDRTPYLVPVTSQYRLDFSDWYRRHTSIKPGDEIIFNDKDGYINIHTPIK